MMPEPLKSALSLGDVEDTSLALPSERELRSAQQRVLDQVHTIKRSKSKYSSKSVSGLTSPTSPESDSVFYDFKFSPGASLGGPSFNRGGTMTNGNMQRQNIVRKSTKSRSSSGQRGNSGSGRLDRAGFYSPTGTLPAQLRTNNQLYSYKATHSAPDLGFQPSANGGAATQRSQSGRQTFRMEKSFSQPNQALGNGTLSRMTNSNQVGTFQGINRRPSSLQSNGESRTSMIRTGQVKDVSGMNAEKLMSDLTMREAVDYLYSPDENYQQCGAAYIQHSTFTNDKAKQEVLALKGIPPLVNLLGSSSPQIQESVAAALRNVVFKNQANKEEVQRSGGIPPAVQLLSNSSSETQKHLTGLLWNLSSADSLKPELLRTALPVLVEKVIEPFSSSADDNGDTSLAPEVFCNATGCLRNLSASKLANRQTMRNSKGLIDSLMRYTENCINAGTPDDQSLENCVCILHNLTYQLETEMPSLFTKINALANARSRSSPSDAGPIGCFSSQSQKLQQESVFDYPVMEDNNPKGAGWLFHSKALQMYLSLLSSSERDATLEASCGALQNLTANDGLVSNVLSHTIVQKLSGLRHISPLLQSSNPALQNSAIALLGNLSRSTPTNQSMARQTLPQLFGFLNSGLAKNDTSPEYDSTMATALLSAQTLLKADSDIGKSLLNNSLINSLNNMSLNMGLPKSSTAAGVFLHSMWSDKNIQTFLKKQGMNKKFFVNDTTSAAFKSLQVID